MFVRTCATGNTFRSGPRVAGKSAVRSSLPRLDKFGLLFADRLVSHAKNSMTLNAAKSLNDS